MAIPVLNVLLVKRRCNADGRAEENRGFPGAECAPRLITIPAAKRPEAQKLQAAAYCRVSSDSQDQLNSFAVQNAHYTAPINENPG